MNFSLVRQAMGQKDPNNPKYDIKIAMFGFLVQVPQGPKYNQKTGKASTKCTVRDDASEVQEVYFIGKTLPTQSIQGQRVGMSISAYIQNTGQTGYSGFYNAQQQVNQQPQQNVIQPIPQQNRSQPENKTPTPDWDAIARGKVRNGLVLADRGQGMSWSEILVPHNIMLHESVVEYICTGKVTEADGRDYGPNDNPADFDWDSPASDDENIPV